MPYNKITIGKIRNIDYKQGIGEIVTKDNVFLFTLDDSSLNELTPGDLVKFRAEKIHDVNKAYFVNKIPSNYKLDNKERISKSKKLISKGE